MDLSNLSSTSGVYAGGNQMDAVSGASSYVPTSESTADPAISQMRSDIQQNSNDFQALKSALNSNNLASATQAFTTLQQDIQTASQSTRGKSPFDSNSPIGKDFAAVGNALNSGNLSAAKQAFASFRQDIKSAGRAARTNRSQNANNRTPTIASKMNTPSASGGNLLDVTA
jgi:hypothetical protein